MLKRICVLCGALLFVAACAQEEEQLENPADALKVQLAQSEHQACAQKAFVQTNAKIAESEALTAEGKNKEAVQAGTEAVEAARVEQPVYEQLVADNDAQKARVDELKSQRDALDAEIAALGDRPDATEDVAKWNNVRYDVDRHLENARAAYDSCDVEYAKSELDAAESLLNDMRASIAGKYDTPYQEPVAEPEQTTPESKVYTVQKGDCLWKIAGSEYSNPFMWPIIYWANKAEIKDPDLIFPGQNFEIAYDFSQDDQAKADHFAKTRGPWSLYDRK